MKKAECWENIWEVLEGGALVSEQHRRYHKTWKYKNSPTMMVLQRVLKSQTVDLSNGSYNRTQHPVAA